MSPRDLIIKIKTGLRLSERPDFKSQQLAFVTLQGVKDHLDEIFKGKPIEELTYEQRAYLEVDGELPCGWARYKTNV